ncbi:TPA: CRISPR-associated endonuclease Cas2 [Patescibacteria group bacterium]|nr:CRISPR-associated endonuclease Cas2 [Patescibacteria group bacterium]
MVKSIPLTKMILLTLAGLADTAVDLGNLTTAVGQRYGSAWRRGGQEYVAELKRLRRKQILRTTINQLRYRKYITARSVGQRLLITLTNKGHAATIVYRLKLAKPHPPGRYTVVIFDVPESQAAARKQLRLLLKQGGFCKLQQSVWLSQTNTYQTVAEFVQQTKLFEWVNVYQADHLLHPPRRAS